MENSLYSWMLFQAMDVKTFWELIRESEGDGQRLATLLQEQNPEDVRGFGDLLDLHFNKAYQWDLWAAAYLMNGGCSEEEFDQFLYWLISMGEETYNNALENPDSLVDVVEDDTSTFTEEIIVAIARSLDRLGQGIEGKSNVTIPTELLEYKKRSRKPRGTEWVDDDELIQKFPKLGERFGHMLEWDEEDEEEDWEDEGEGKSKFKKAWDKFVDFFARIFDKFVNLFKKKEKEEEEEDDAEEDVNRLEKNMKLNFWLYLTFLVLSIGFIVLIPCTILIQNNILDRIELLRSFQELNLDWVIENWSTSYYGYIERMIKGFEGTPWGGLENRLVKWGRLQYLWIMCALIFLIGGLPIIKLIIQPKYIQLNDNSLEFINKKEEEQLSIKLKNIKSIALSRSNSLEIVQREKTQESPIIYLDIISVKKLKQYCVENKIEIDEDTHLLKMIFSWLIDKIKKYQNK